MLGTRSWNIEVTLQYCFTYIRIPMPRPNICLFLPLWRLTGLWRSIWRPIKDVINLQHQVPVYFFNIGSSKGVFGGTFPEWHKVVKQHPCIWEYIDSTKLENFQKQWNFFDIIHGWGKPGVVLLHNAPTNRIALESGGIHVK